MQESDNLHNHHKYMYILLPAETQHQQELNSQLGWSIFHLQQMALTSTTSM